MRTIIAGSRDITDPAIVARAVAACGWPITHVISGTARGVDQLGETWAIQQGLPLTRMPADWDRYGKSAGYRRNEEMAKIAEAALLLWDGVSPGTRHMRDIATARGLRVYVYRTDQPPPPLLAPANPGVAAITYRRGDATQPVTNGPIVIVHCCNDIGAWGAGFVLALSRRWPLVEARYRAWFAGQTATCPRLGAVQFVPVAPDWWVANLIGQRGLRSPANPVPLSYTALGEGLGKVAAFARRHQATVHAPRLGCGLAGGTWPRVEALLDQHLIQAGIAVTVYDPA